MRRYCHLPWLPVRSDAAGVVCEESLTVDCELETLDPHASLTKRSGPLRPDGIRES
jgi:hypothetical protein